MTKQPTCNDCALQFQDACPNRFAQNEKCSRFVWEEKTIPQPPSNSGRAHGRKGEFLDEPQAPIVPRFSSSSSTPQRPWKPVYKGQRLYYKNKSTGKIQSGTVVWAGRHVFCFRFNMGEVKLGYDVLSNRLFKTKAGAQKYGRKA